MHTSVHPEAANSLALAVITSSNAPLNARKLDYANVDNVRLLLSVSDVTDARLAESSRTTCCCAKSRSCSRSSSTALPTACRSSPACSCKVSNCAPISPNCAAAVHRHRDSPRQPALTFPR